MRHLPALLLASVAILTPGAGRADVAYRFDVTSAYATADPFPNRLDTSAAGTDTGYVQIVNAGNSDYGGILRLVAVSPLGVDMGFSFANGVLPAGGSVSIAIANDASDAGGFNGPAGTFRPGAIVYLEGFVTAGNESEPVKLAVQDLDLHSGVFRTDPNGLRTDDFVLQGGDPFGFDNGDAFELSQAWGHATLAGVVVPEPGMLWAFALALTALLPARVLRASRPWQNGPVRATTRR